MALPTLNDDQRLYLQTIFDYFHEHGKWPTYRYVDRKLTQIRRDLDIEKIAKSLPSGFASTFAFNLILDDEAILSISAIYLCVGSGEELADFIKVLHFCVEKYFSVEEDTVQISSDDLRQHLDMSELSVHKVGLLIKNAYDYYIYTQFGYKDNEDNSWVLTLSRNIREFDGVTSIEQYLERLDKSKTASPYMSLRHTSPAENAETSESGGHYDLSDNLDEEENVTSIGQQYSYDVALSFAGEDRIHAVALAEALFRRRVKVFYDKYEKSTLWGKDLYIHLSDLYQNKARYCVMFFSQYYVAKAWTKHELKAAQARALNENKEYILPIRLDSTEIPGILQTTAYLNWHEETPESVAEAILEKLGKVSHVPLIKERTIMDWLVDEAQMSNGKVSVDLGDIPGVKHSMRMTKNNENWEAWYGMWFEQEFTERMGFEPTEECIRYALERYAEIAE